MKSNTEERLLVVIDEEGEGVMLPVTCQSSTRRDERLQDMNRAAINRFLGKGHRVNVVTIVPGYYGELLAWALHRYIERNCWTVITTLNYELSRPVYIDVNTDYDKRENLLLNGQLLIERDDCRLIITVDSNLRWRNSVQVEGPASKDKTVQEFVDGINTIVDEENFYRYKKIEFGGRLRFLDLHARSWDSITVDSRVKKEIRDNTVLFLNKKELWRRHGIPLKRGILLAGEPGTGKTVICKALMAEAQEITCITTNAYKLNADEYITELYELARDMSPCIVFIEDIDLIGQNREEFGYQSGPALLSLLAVLDGVEEKEGIVTVATTNNLEILDKAIRQRPSRFDRVIKLSLPSLEQRKELVSLLCQNIPIGESTQAYIAYRAEHCTPAQLQEIIFGLAIQYLGESEGSGPICLDVGRDDVDAMVSRVNGNRHKIGFAILTNHNGEEPCLVGTSEPGEWQDDDPADHAGAPGEG